MKTIQKPSENLGGLLKVWAVPFNEFSVNGSAINLINPSNIWEIYCSPESIEFKEMFEKTKSGNHYNTVISGFIPHDSQPHQEAIEYIENRKWVIIFIDGNEKCKLAGNSTDPLRLYADLSTGKEIASLSGYSFQFSGITKQRAIFIDNPF